MRKPLHLGGPAHWAMASWSWLGAGRWQAYDNATSRTIEQAHKQGQATVRIALKNGQYDIDLKKMQQVHATRPSKTRTIRREDGQASSTASTCSAATSARSVRSSGSSTDELSLVSQMQVLHMQIPCCSVASEDEKSSVQLQFSKKWDTSREPEPSISEIYTIHVSATVQERFTRCCEAIGEVPAYGYGESPGNQQRRFHGTRQICNFKGQPCDSEGCSACGIIREGFKLQYISTGSGNRGAFGEGHYATSMSATAKGYGGSQNVVIVTKVAAGKVEIVRQTTTAAIAAGCHSRVAMKSNGVDEIVVPDDAQMLPLFLIRFA
ncbi:unnamed protein product [Effrenium voratum]|uniref:WWE domain-containing protein n=2 Tax=Effrenium voratum TaxID=2562239 RepID=A0AA36J2G9_9DINO|nr:unnamed protein product [Effrenium voratum]